MPLLGPFVALAFPLLDAADPPPMPVPPMPAGASRAELLVGASLPLDVGLEFDLALVSAGYLVAWPNGGVEPKGTIGTRLTTTHFIYADSQLIDERYWIGPFVRVELGTELMGREASPGQVSRGQLDVGLRMLLSSPLVGDLSLGYGLVHDQRVDPLHHGIRVQFALSAR